MARGRRRQAIRPVVYSVKLVLYPSVDDDLIAYLSLAGPRLRATLVKLAMRNGRLNDSVAHAASDDDFSFDDLMQ